jgi:hypothetical protein
MKKCILVVDWLKWHRTKRPEPLQPFIVQAYENHYNNLFIWNERLETFLQAYRIDYHIQLCDFQFPKKKKIKV